MESHEMDDLKRKEMRLKVELAQERVREAKVRTEAAEARREYWIEREDRLRPS